MKKRIATFLIAMVVLCSGTTFANELVPASKAVSSSIANLLQTKIDYPDFARIDNYECCVVVRLFINEDGSFEIDCANCKDDRLKMHVKDSIDKIISKEHARYAGQTVSIKVIFKLLD